VKKKGKQTEILNSRLNQYAALYLQKGVQ